MKRALSIVLALLLAVSLVACGKPGGEKPGPSPSGSEPPVSAQPQETPSAVPSEEPSQEPSKEPEPSVEPSAEPEPSAPLWEMPLPEPTFEYSSSDSTWADVISCTLDEARAYVQQLIAAGFKYNYLEDTDKKVYFSGNDGTGLQIRFKVSDEESYLAADFLEKASGFGTGWATNDFEMLFPEPPFDGWVKEQTGPNTYEMEVQGGLDTTGEDRAKLLDYFRILCSYGFHIEVTGSVEGADGQPWDYEWNVTDGHGNSIEFVMDSGWCWITVTTGGSVSAEPAPSAGSSWTTNPAAQALPEPPATYAVAERQSSDTFCLIEITYATFNEIVSYAAMLRDCGFNVDVQESSEETADGRLLYNYKAKNSDGCSVSLSFSTMEGDYTVTYVEVYSN